MLCRVLLAAWCFVAASAIGTASNTTLSDSCSCGFIDPKTNTIYTESIIVYFNETSAADQDAFEGASPSNLYMGNNGSLSWQNEIDGTQPSLEMILDGERFDHLSEGAELRSIRKDILRGTFRAAMRSAHPWVGGSAMSMFLKYNDSQSLQVDLLNKDAASDAQVMQLINGEYPGNEHALNYSFIQDGTPGFPGRSPWTFMDVGFDWSTDTVDFYVNGNRTRHATKKDRTLPLVPEALHFEHWSTGDVNYMEGPPVNASVANVKWVRGFFNSSLMNAADHADYDHRCRASSPCSADDTSIRGSTAYTVDATKPYKEPRANERIRDVAGYVAASFAVIGIISLFNALIRRAPWHKLAAIRFTPRKGLPADALRRSLRASVGEGGIAAVYGPSESVGTTPPAPGYSSSYGTPAPSYRSRQQSTVSLHGGPAHKASNAGLAAVPARIEENEALEADSSGSSHKTTSSDAFEGSRDEDGSTSLFYNQIQLDSAFKQEHAEKHCRKNEVVEPAAPAEYPVLHETIAHDVPDAMTGGATVDPTQSQLPKEPQKRIDHLAGLVVVMCFCVTLRHFSLTFWPYVTEASGEIKHFHADWWLAYVLGPYILTPFSIGPFFITACRFLAQRYLRTGNLQDIGTKMLLRAPRMLIPCFIFITLEYFLMELGLVTKLEWVPSVSFSTWPYTTPQPNFGVFLDELVELSYIIPNGAPEVVNHYCVGVLWTIPVQLQFSFLVLMGTVMVRDIKQTWKRAGFYALAIVAGWYARSWSSLHWAGLMLADADINYGWLKWTRAKWYRHYPILFLAVGITLASPLTLLFNGNIYSFPFLGWENGLHPDPMTGRPLFDLTKDIYGLYPAYNAPNVAVLTFSIGLQIVVELSKTIQWCLSAPFITFFHPHIMTVYLLHGFVFWSLGSWLAVSLSSTGIPYWALLLIVAVVCYTVILIFTIVISPMTEMATKGSTKNILRWATEEPVPHRQTTAPFGKHVVLDRMENQIQHMDEARRDPATQA